MRIELPNERHARCVDNERVTNLDRECNPLDIEHAADLFTSLERQCSLTLVLKRVMQTSLPLERNYLPAI